MTLRSSYLASHIYDGSDLSPLLCNIRLFPHLTTFTLFDNFSSSHQWDGVASILQSHAHGANNSRSFVLLCFQASLEQHIIPASRRKNGIILEHSQNGQIPPSVRALPHLLELAPASSMLLRRCSVLRGCRDSGQRLREPEHAKNFQHESGYPQPTTLVPFASKLPGLETLGFVYQHLSAERSLVEQPPHHNFAMLCHSITTLDGNCTPSTLTTTYIGYVVERVRRYEQVLREALPGVETLRPG
ncbi:hypothetical protein LshimejAT787_0601000 [Lyophyllum shimeji]|uniref:Uncharacterized protein n=1 Tax=Lyophyllum shimeji TaxID=47721 RepID=A0A9P3PN47_LYOSH|nr:hypothetical protein LshimejAT787_0601000 [Lyophyllum shimeji]